MRWQDSHGVLQHKNVGTHLAAIGGPPKWLLGNARCHAEDWIIPTSWDVHCPIGSCGRVMSEFVAKVRGHLWFQAPAKRLWRPGTPGWFHVCWFDGSFKGSRAVDNKLGWTAAFSEVHSPLWYVAFSIWNPQHLFLKWRFPEMGVPVNHLFEWHFPL